MKRTPLKRTQKPLKRTPLRKVSEKKKLQFTDTNTREKDIAFYFKIWKTRPHYCFETGEFLGDELLSYKFHHVLEKETYPQFRYEEWNIVLVSLTVHDQVGMDIDRCPKIKAYREKLLKSNPNQ